MNAEFALAAAKLRKEIRSCTSCGLSNDVTPVPFRGDVPAHVLIVGEAPGREENRKGEPFVGPSGRLIQEVVRKTLVGVEGIAYANTVSCFPNRTPYGYEVAACRHNLIAQVQLIRPEFVVLLGGVALSAWWKDLRIGDARGRMWWLPSADWDFAPITAMATWHPAAVLRTRSLYSELLLDFVRLGQVVRAREGRGRVLPLDPSCVLCKDRSNDEVWTAAGDGGVGVDVSDVGGAVGIAWCKKHWEHRVKALGKKDEGRKVRVTKKKVEEAMGTGLFEVGDNG